MYVHVFTCMYACTCICVYKCTCICIYTCTCMYVYNYVFIACSISFRRATTVWHWPYCVNVEEKTFEQLVILVQEYWNTQNHTPSLPFTDTR